MPFEEPGGIALIVIFEPNLPLADMKARLVLNRLSSKARILSTDPPAERLDEVDPLTRFTVYLTADCDADELRSPGRRRRSGRDPARAGVSTGPSATRRRPSPTAEAKPPTAAAARASRREVIGLQAASRSPGRSHRGEPTVAAPRTVAGGPGARDARAGCGTRRRQSRPAAGERPRSPRRSASTATGSTT